ncbi:MAG: PAS domain S-box protein [Cyanobacteria bacterium P01_A01_bin.84]
MLTLSSPTAVVDFYPPTVTKETSVFDAIAKMCQHESHYNFLLVVEDKHLLGLLTNSDIVSFMTDGDNFKVMKVSEVMQTSIDSIPWSNIQNTEYVLSLLNQNQLGLLAVIDEQTNLIGIITSKNFCRNLKFNLEEPTPTQDRSFPSVPAALSNQESSLYITKDASQNLQQDLKKDLQVVIDALPGYISWVSSQGYYLGVNKRLSDFFDLSPIDFVGQEVGFMEISPAFTQFINDFLHGSDFTRSTIVEIKQKKNSHIYLIIAQKYQQNTAAVLIGIDITQHQKLEKALKQMNAELAIQMESRANAVIEMNQQLVEEISKSQVLQEQLQRSQQMLQKVIDNIPQSISWKDRSCVYLGCNHKFAQDALKNSCDDIVNKTDYDLAWTKEEALAYSQRDIRVMEDNQPDYHRIETRQNCSKNGNIDSNLEQTWLNINRIPLNNSQGDVIGILCTYEDITEHKIAEESLLRFRKALESLSDSILITDAHSNVIYLNKAFTQLFGYSCEELNRIGGTTAIFRSKVSAIKTLNYLQQGEPWSDRVTLISCSNRLIDVELQADVIKDRNGARIGEVIIFTDVSEKIRIETELKLHKKAIATSTDGIVIADATLPNIPIIYANPKFEKITGYPVSEAIGKNRDFFLTNYQTVQDQNEIEALIAEAIKRTVTISSYRKNKTKYFNDLNICCVYDYQGLLTNYIVIHSDVTEIKQLEQQLRDALEAEKGINQLKSDFITMTSHEFRTPLSTILSSSELLENYHHKWDDIKKNKHFLRIKTSVIHMTNMLEDVLTFSKAEAKKLELILVHLELVEYCNKLVEEFQNQNNHNQNMVRMNFQTHCQTISAYMDGQVLNSILSNILLNAIKYSPSHSTVDFTLTAQDNEAVFIIEDKGIGIDDEDLPHIFDSFYRAKNIGNISGTGLGLAIVKECIEVCHGRISVDSKLNQGTTFIINLPLNNKT